MTQPGQCSVAGARGGGWGRRGGEGSCANSFPSIIIPFSNGYYSKNNLNSFYSTTILFCFLQITRQSRTLIPGGLQRVQKLRSPLLKGQKFKGASFSAWSKSQHNYTLHLLPGILPSFSAFLLRSAWFWLKTLFKGKVACVIPVNQVVTFDRMNRVSRQSNLRGWQEVSIKRLK